MVRRRTAVSIAAAALLLASPALTACGSGPAQPGAAAVVGGQRITVSTLQDKVNEVRAAQAASPQAQQLISASGKLSTQTLSMLVQNTVIERAAADAGVTVSDGEVQQQHAAALQQFSGSEQALDAALLQQYDIVPSGADSFFRTNALVGKLIMSLGFQPGSDGGQTAVVDAISKTADKMGVKINPRYGAWDSKKAIIGDATDPWVVTKTPGEAAPAA
ncbi:SurA N-terminal domain-containing protein [Actinacidiphila bryophytorum]|uniref:SurA N-terminal domain-containing protein n=1 Tax=Actinacidiphila bryophytorum TaxID=1436133 RepID=A0A9W4H0D8_9ACTN|nr:SurA N-terminal domain-containing protein [Actinacidiphila bryophytorum]MBM9438680.1 SurA N-terminal domain-containing protein [Actinacidiphila bryophytorum]MBN6543919.1 SurA N-terminal domain-containing protein [Actinacidiphila bryophytorum]CAG7637045.1 SurA N-terminal domain-containing protein [Actinacidiphila bryophytorum]